MLNFDFFHLKECLNFELTLNNARKYVWKITNNVHSSNAKIFSRVCHYNHNRHILYEIFRLNLLDIVLTSIPLEFIFVDQAFLSFT